ncbi:MAG: FHA domain-containing serine/threonine-protein kinase [Bacteroidales bacterium]|nr:FHA domain-containing serine/threonine-protein kinase [Bacteroidales bacterium]
MNLLPKIPHYHVDSLIESGGTAAVYRGVDLRSGYEVAIKALFPSRAKDDFIMERFREEANHYLYLSHPNIVKLVEFVEDRDKFYLIMEFVNGTPLDVYLNTRTVPMSDETVIPLFCQILDTIDYLHQNEILHLDIKPGNIMVLKNWNIKILDMGISAKVNDKSNNLKKCGSPAFMAPEQINKEQLGRYTDIFALGVTFFNVITGKLPFSGVNHTDTFEKICNNATPVAADFYSDVNPKYQPIVERALQKRGSERYQSCKEFKEDLLKLSKKEEKNTKNTKKVKNAKDMKIISIGRDINNDIVINDSFVGRQHLQMIFDDAGKATLIDLHTKNGTFVNGKRITSGEEVSLNSTDIVRIGNTTLPWKNYLPDQSIVKTDVKTQKVKKEKKPFPWGKIWQYVWRTALGLITMLITYYILSLIKK